MVHEDGFLIGSGGTELYWQAWSPSTRPIADVVVVHGLAEHSGRYAALAADLTEHGYRVFTLDHRGHGRSAGRRLYVEAFETFVADLETFRLQIVGPRSATETLPTFLVGHSMGGAIALAHALMYTDVFTGLVLSGPAIVRADVAKSLELVGRVLSRVSPTAGVVVLDSSEVSRDPAVVAAYDADPYVHRGKITARLGAELVDRGAAFAGQVDTLSLPVLHVHGSDDALVSCADASAVFNRMGSTDKTLKVFDGLFHEVFNEPERDEVIQTVIDWMNQRR